MAENFYSNTARFFVKNRQLSLLLTLAGFAFGLFAFAASPKQYNPEITLPAFRITTSFPGATAEEVERLVTNEIENRLAEIPGVDQMTSQSFSGGQSIVSVIFEIGSDLEESKIKVSEKILSNLDHTPLGAGTSLIQQINPENVPVMSLALTSEDYSPEGLRTFAFDLKEHLKTVPGISNIAIIGGRSRQLNVLLNPEKMQARGVGISDITQTIAANNFYLNSQSLEGPERNIPLEIDGNLKSGEELARLLVGGTPSKPVYLEDVATVDDGNELVENHVGFTEKSELNGTPEIRKPNAVFLSFAKLKGANISDVTNAAEARLETLGETLVPAGIDIKITRNEGETAHEEILMLTEHLTLAILIVTATLLLFLGWRAALVVATAIPLTLALVFIVGFFMGQTINRITLFALIFSLGLLVDDAIVVVENIYRHFSKDEEPRNEAIAHATGEVGMGVLLSTVTAVIVFVPMGLVTGMMGAYMGPIAFFAPVARLASLVVAYTLSPYLSSIFLKSHGKGEGEGHSAYEIRYKTLIRKILDSKKIQNLILASAGILVLVTFTFPIVELVHFRMLPKADKDQFYLYLDMPENTPLSKMNTLADLAIHEALKDPHVESAEAFVGTPPVIDFNGLFRGSDMRRLPYQATLKINLVSAKKRSPTSETIAFAMRPKILAALGDAPDLRLKLVEDPPGPPVLSTLLARVKGPDPKTREGIARDLLVLFRETPGVTDIDSSLPSGTPQERLTLDHEKLASSGLSVAEVAQAIDMAVRGEAIGMAHLGTRERTSIVVRFEKAARQRVNDLSRIQLKTRGGRMVSLASVVTFESVTASAPLWHDDREPMTIVAGEMAGRAVAYAAKDLIFKLLDYRLPNRQGRLVGWNLFGFTFRDMDSGEDYKIEWGGEFEMTLENFRDLGLAMLISYFLIYVILVAQFRSFKSPALIMTTILLGFAGVMPGFAVLDMISGIYFSATSMIGVIALGGIVVGNAILLLDFIQQLQARGLTPKNAIVEACHTRLRPILLTSITAILGSIVIVSDPVWSGLAWAITFGLTLSTVLTLVIFPVLYYRFGDEISPE